MTRMHDVLSPDDRAEFDSLFLALPTEERPLIRIVEIFMRHQLNHAALLNEEIRGLLAKQGKDLSEIHTLLIKQATDLVDHERRLRVVEHGGHSHHPHGPALAGD